MKKIIDIIADIAWFLVGVVLILIVINSEMPKEFKVETVYCEVIEKDTETVIIPTGKAIIPVKKYKLTFLVGNVENETTIYVEKEVYQNIDVGDSILCDIFYDSEGIENITIADSNIVTD